MKTDIALALLLGLLLMTPPLLAQVAQSPATGGPDLVAALKAVPGCLGVETARTATGKQVIFAWFQNKKALLDWYYSPVHQQLMAQFFPGATLRTPMPDVVDNGQPILAIASLTMAESQSAALPRCRSRKSPSSCNNRSPEASPSAGGSRRRR
jgi:hypothetical protein